MLQDIVKRTLRVPIVSEQKGDGESVTRQLDVALMGIGCKLSADLFAHFTECDPQHVSRIGSTIITAMREALGGHIQHNTYFRDFPSGVPDTRSFWLTEICRWILTGNTRYGRYQHSYEEMLAHHEEFLASAKDRVTLLHLGKTLAEETQALYTSLATSPIPLNEADRILVKQLAEICVLEAQPMEIPVRETRAIINSVRLTLGQPIFVDTVTDVLRLACALSDGDVTLQEATKFRSFSRSEQRALLHALDDVVATSPAQLADIIRYRERWKRLGERLYPHRCAEDAPAREVFAVARGDKQVRSLEAKAELALQDGDLQTAIALLTNKPGVLIRNVDRLLRLASAKEREIVQDVLAGVSNRVSGRVLLSLREHLHNRSQQGSTRIFTNSKGRAWVMPDTLAPLDEATLAPLQTLLDQEITRRLSPIKHLMVDPAVLDVALPLSDKNKAAGFAILPRGSMMPVEQGLLRFFVYWKQQERRTDYDLSALILDEHFEQVTQLSWTNLQSLGGTHSGDLTEARNGASEFIDLYPHLIKKACYIIPQVNIYAGENFNEVAECFFGFMHREADQKGKPFEAATVRTRSDLRGVGKIALPLIFVKGGSRQWYAKWMHLYLKGNPRWNRVENNRLTTGLLAQSIVNRDYLTVGYLVDLLKRKSETFSWMDEATVHTDTTFIGLQAPEGIPDGCKVITLQNLHELIPS